MNTTNLERFVDLEAYPLQNVKFVQKCNETLNTEGVLTLKNFLNWKTIEQLVKEAKENQHKAFYSNSTHNIYLTPQDENFPEDHIFNTQITSSKGCITTDQIPDSSALKTIYKSDIFKKFIAEIVGEKILY